MASHNILAIIQARTGSTRLPGKVLLDLAGKTALEHVIGRIRSCSLVDEFIVATTINRHDLAIVNLCADLGVRVYCGCEDDPLERYFQAARLYGGDHIVRIKADCPLIDPHIVDEAVRLHLTTGADYTTNTVERTYPVGQDVEILTRASLQKLWRRARLFSEREHITLYIHKHPEEFHTEHLKCTRDYSHKRWTMDNLEDYQLLKIVFEALYPHNPNFSMQDVLNFLEKHPDLEKLNAHIAVDAGIKKSMAHDRIVPVTPWGML
ncbi:cytidylyltransferase domain-containing protein [Desulfosoma sp.]